MENDLFTVPQNNPTEVVFRAKTSLHYFVGCMILTLGIYAFTKLANFSDPENALYVGGGLSFITFLNYSMFELIVTRSAMTFCSYRTFFSRKYLPLRNISEYNFTATQVGGGVQVDIYDTSKNMWASFAVESQDTEFAEAMRILSIQRRGIYRKKENKTLNR